MIFNSDIVKISNTLSLAKLVIEAFDWKDDRSFTDKSNSIGVAEVLTCRIKHGDLIMLHVAILFHHFLCVCKLHLSCVFVVTLSYHQSIFVVFKNQSLSISLHLS